MIAAGILGFTSGPVSALLLGMVQAQTHTAYLGRVMALVSFSAVGLVPVAFPLFGLLIQTSSLTAAFLLCAVADLITALFALSLRRVRTARGRCTDPAWSGAGRQS